MQALRLGWGITWRMVAWGVCSGVASGGLLGAIFLMGSAWASGLLIGALVGGAAGLVLSLAIGLTLTVITLWTVNLPQNMRRYRTAAGTVSVLYVIMSVAVLAAWLQFQNFASYVGLACIPAVIAAVAAWWASMRVAAWVERESEVPQSTQIEQG